MSRSLSVACDLAEVIGTAIVLQLLFGIPLIAGALLTALDAFLLLLLINKGFRLLEAFVIALLVVIATCFAADRCRRAAIGRCPARFRAVAGHRSGPRNAVRGDRHHGETVMPHNLYLHSSVVQTRAYGKSVPARRDAIRWATIDSTIALTLALLINAAILIVAAAVFHASGYDEVAEIGDTFRPLSPLLDLGIASTLFAVALLASGLNFTVTTTLAGQIVMEGFLRLRIPS